MAAASQPFVDQSVSLQVSPATLPHNSSPFAVPSSTAQPLNPTAVMWEHMVATMARLESRLDEQDREHKATTTILPPRVEPEPPYGSGLPGSFGMPNTHLQSIQTPTVSMSGARPQGFATGPSPLLSTSTSSYVANAGTQLSATPLSYPPTAYIPVDQVHPNPNSGFMHSHVGSALPQQHHVTSLDPPDYRTHCEQPRQGSSWDIPAARPHHYSSTSEPPRFYQNGTSKV